MSTEHKGNMIRDIPPDGEMSKPRPLGAGDLLVSEAPEGEPLWKKKKKINEDETEGNCLNEGGGYK